ncbi:sensor histidine kinase [Amycolatopsis panacis]|uniref:histidine kinase n=1 Tax=Amycolatopsis panacis TaxID=2340917 RepID=A0A419IB21_9PSEU|nr:histidine kinase [Amycolatopsis panacis]RJQ91255.1 two-component sensor histidine kinase [Amycolatopsis panacis]
MRRTAEGPLRRGLVIAEIVILAALNLELFVRKILPHGLPLAELGFFTAGLVAGGLALLRRRYPGRTAVLTTSAIALSLVCSLVGLLAVPSAALGGDPEVFALALLAGASCHRLPTPQAAGLVALGGAAIAVAPLARYGVGLLTLVTVVLWLILWGCSVVVGLILRDGDTRREAALAAARNRERLDLARELHDLVAHHITGVVVRTQAAGVVLAGGPEQELLQEIEHAGAEALAAVRRLVMMLRSPEEAPSFTTGGLVETVEAAVDGDTAVTLELAPGLAELAVTPETVSTVHRVVLEALTNVRKHAPEARQIVVDVAPAAAERTLRVEVRNDGLRQTRARRAPGGYGLVGMRERIMALEGRLTAGEHGARGWRVLAELPLPAVTQAIRPTGRGAAQ